MAAGRENLPRIETPEFIARVRAGDPDALQAVAHAYLPQILRAARGAGLAAQAAEDAAQATFTTFLESLDRFEGRSKVRTWLFGILYKKVAEMRRAWAKDLKHDPIDDVMEARFREDGSWLQPPRPLDEQVYYGSEVRRKLDECLEEAPVKQRMAFILREVEGLGTAEICKILGVTGTHLGVIFHRARNRLRECLESKGIG